MTSELAGRRIGFIGGGAMARALAGGLLEAGVARDCLRASDPDASQRDRFQQELGISPTADNGEVVAGSDMVVLAVKPGVVPGVLDALRESPRDRKALARPLWVSIAAGVPITRLAAALPEGTRIIRAMPNTPALVGAGATGWCANAEADEADLCAADALFRSVGKTWQAPDEALLDAVTGLSGSGPAYVFLLLEALIEAGAREGLPHDAAQRLVLQTVYGAAKLALESGEDPATLREQVSSPGGTTLAGLEQLERRGVREALIEAVAAAAARARELGRP